MLKRPESIIFATDQKTAYDRLIKHDHQLEAVEDNIVDTQAQSNYVIAQS